jgi:hypothetical protein
MLIFGIVLGAGGSYLAMKEQMQILIREHEYQLDQLQDALEITTSRKEAEIEDLESAMDDIQNAIDSLQNQNTQYQREITSLETDIESLEYEVWSKEADVAYLEDRIDDILDLDIKQHYEWNYGWSDWTWDITIPLELYWDFYDENRPEEWDNWVDMCKDSRDDYYINELVDAFETAASKQGYSKYETVEYVIAFIQSLPYTVDDETTPWNEYPRYPIETLFDRGGDCEDTSILTAAILHAMGYDVALLILDNDNHCAVGIAGGEGVYGTYYIVDGTKYYFIETTGDGWGIGDFPSFDSGKAYVYPLNN